MKLTIAVRRMESGAVTFTLQGPLDGETSALLDREAAKALAEQTCAIILDMTGVDFITSAGIGTIMKVKTSLARRKAELAMIGMQPQVQKAFEIIRVLPTMQVFQGRTELDEYLGRVQRQMTGQEED